MDTVQYYIYLTGEIHFQIFSEIFCWIFWVCHLSQEQHTPLNKEIVSVLGRAEGYTVKYIPSPEGVAKGEA